MVAWRSPVTRAGGGRQVGRALAVEVGQHDDLAGGLDGVAVDPEPRRRSGRRRASRSACRRAAGTASRASAKPATTPVGSAAGALGHGERRARGAEADDRDAGLQAEARRRAHVVAGARGDDGALRAGPGRRPRRRARRPPPRRRAGRAGSSAGSRSTRASPSTSLGVGAGGGRPPAAARRVAAVGHGLAAQPLGQEVVGEADGRGLRGALRLLAAQPRPLRDGERRGRDGADGGGPAPRARRDPRAAPRRPARSSCRSTAPPGPVGRPAASSTTRPCCCPATAIARRRARRTRSARARRAAPSTRPPGRSAARRPRRSTACGALPRPATVPSCGSTTRTVVLCVEQSIPATSPSPPVMRPPYPRVPPTRSTSDERLRAPPRAQVHLRPVDRRQPRPRSVRRPDPRRRRPRRHRAPARRARRLGREPPRQRPRPVRRVGGRARPDRRPLPRRARRDRRAACRWRRRTSSRTRSSRTAPSPPTTRRSAASRCARRCDAIDLGVELGADDLRLLGRARGQRGRRPPSRPATRYDRYLRGAELPLRVRARPGLRPALRARAQAQRAARRLVPADGRRTRCTSSTTSTTRRWSASTPRSRTRRWPG